ncbi:MAG: GTP-dependent nucleic acid-binding protein engD [Candidatus Levybacteria bacterium GW2011_GWA2_40_8]|nr:MAG: GTP-dependent nucleic acid-binding protein engD [Candidatus Levybacteria bacterium GW2011_GWA2_40_8]
MNLSVGIAGLPNVGKSTLFNALLKKQIANVANYPFCTIEPNVGVIEVPDGRLPVLAKIVKTEKIVPAIVEFYDIAGLVKGASVGEGLGNKFLSHIREVSAIIHVVRLFKDDSIIHVSSEIKPEDDIKTIETELMLADLATIEKQKEPRGNATKEEMALFGLVKKLKGQLNDGLPVRKMGLTDEENASIKQLNLLTAKPTIYLFNVSEEQLTNKKQTEEQIVRLLDNSAIEQFSNFILINAKLENEILTLSEKEQKEYLSEFKLEDTGLNRLIKKAYETLGLISFLTAGEKEVRAWTIRKGTNAQEAAGAIHTDFIKKFIKADVVVYEDFVSANGWLKVRELGKVSTVGRDYLMKDGEVVEFKIGS